jgi:hypothetical protein
MTANRMESRASTAITMPAVAVVERGMLSANSLFVGVVEGFADIEGRRGVF